MHNEKRWGRKAVFRHCLVLLMMVLLGNASWGHAETEFAIRGYQIDGNDLVPDGDIQELLWPYIGYEKTAEDVGKARAEVEKYLQKQGFVRAMVSIPEQNVEDGIVRLEIIKTVVGRVQVTGNRYYTKEMLMRELPSIAPGQVLKVSRINEDFGQLARDPNLKVKLELTPSKKPGEDTIRLQVEDQLPLHGKLELNNKSSHSTSDLRLSGMVRYDNLWQKRHSVSIQGQISPENTEEVRVLSGSYVMPRESDPSQLFVFYGVWSDSETAATGDIDVIGKGNIYGLRYVRPLPKYRDYAHNLTLGVDYKDFDETIDFSDGSEDPIITPVTYLPLSLSYGGSLKDENGMTMFRAGLSGTVRELVSKQEEFSEKNYQSRGNYLALSAALDRRQVLNESFKLNMRVAGQLVSEPLIANEQYIAGGMDSVHGYKESEASGDDALYASAQLVGPDIWKLLKKDFSTSTIPSLVYEYTNIRLKEPLEGQEKSVVLSGLGLVVQGQVKKKVKYRLDWGLALVDTEETDSGTQRGYFNLSYEF